MMPDVCTPRLKTWNCPWGFSQDAAVHMSRDGNEDTVLMLMQSNTSQSLSLHQNKKESPEILEQISVHPQREVSNHVTTAPTQLCLEGKTSIWDSICSECKKEGHWQAKCTGGQPNQSNACGKSQWHNQKGKQMSYRSLKKHKMCNMTK